MLHVFSFRCHTCKNGPSSDQSCLACFSFLHWDCLSANLGICSLSCTSFGKKGFIRTTTHKSWIFFCCKTMYKGTNLYFFLIWRNLSLEYFRCEKKDNFWSWGCAKLNTKWIFLCVTQKKTGWKFSNFCSGQGPALQVFDPFLKFFTKN